MRGVRSSPACQAPSDRERSRSRAAPWVTGLTELNGGFLNVGSAENFGTSGPLGVGGTISFTGGTLQYSSVNAFDYSPRFSNAAGQLYRIDTNNTNVTYTAGLTSIGGTFTKLGPGILTLSGANTYTGATTVLGGTLQAASADRFSPNSAFTVTSPGILDLNSANQTIGSLAGTGDTTLGVNAVLTAGGNNTSTAYSGVISGTGTSGLTKEGTGTLTLSGLNTYTGATNINAGTIQAGLVNTLPGSSAVTVASGATLNLAGFSQTIGSIAGAGNTTLGANATLTAGGDNTSTSYSGAISGTGTSGLTKQGTGTLTLSGLNTYSGATNVSAGTLQAGLVNTLPNNTAVTVANGAILDLKP